MGVSAKAGSDRTPTSPELIFRCRACGNVSELLGWARDVFQTCALRWERDSLGKELECLRRIFQGADDAKGKHLCWKSQEILEKMKNGFDTNIAIKEMLFFFQGVDSLVQSFSNSIAKLDRNTFLVSSQYARDAELSAISLPR